MKKTRDSKMKTCVCIKCKNTQNELVVYQEEECNHVLHLILTLLTGIWCVVWYIQWQGSKTQTEKNFRGSVLSLRCDKCDGQMMVLS